MQFIAGLPPAFDLPVPICSLMVNVIDSGSSSLGSSPGQENCVVFLGKTLYSHSASLHPGVQMGTSERNARGNPGTSLSSSTHTLYFLKTFLFSKKIRKIKTGIQSREE